MVASEVLHSHWKFRMRLFLIRIYRYLFARECFHALNRLLFDCSLRGLGILNYESNALSGEATFLSQYLKGKNRCIVFDVGANVGKYSSEILTINPATVVYAFEPHPKTFLQLTANINSPNFLANNCAVGHEQGFLTLYDYADRDGSSHASLYKDVIETIHKAKSVEHKVEVIALHAFVKRNSIDAIDLLKIDTEGNELNVLKGLSEYLRNGRVKAIHFEFNEMNVSSRTYFRDFWDLLPNFLFFRLLPKGLTPITNYVPVSCEIFAYQNIVAILKKETERTGFFVSQ